MAHVASWQCVRTKVRGVVGRITFAVLTLLQLAAIANFRSTCRRGDSLLTFLSW